MEENQDTLANTAQSDIQWIPVSITAEYPKGDILGKMLAFSSMLPHALICSFITLILFRRDLHTMAYFAGLVINEAINYVLKHTFKQGRPMVRTGLYDKYGMPSSHSQFLWFFAVYMFLFVWIRLRHISNSTSGWSWLWKTLISVGCIATAVVVSFARIYLQYHSVAQVAVGSLIGSLLGLLWFLFTHLVLTPWFPTIASWRLCEWLLIRDQTLIPNILWFEYTTHRTEMRARSRKLVSMKSQ